MKIKPLQVISLLELAVILASYWNCLNYLGIIPGLIVTVFVFWLVNELGKSKEQNSAAFLGVAIAVAVNILHLPLGQSMWNAALISQKPVLPFGVSTGFAAWYIEGIIIGINLFAFVAMALEQRAERLAASERRKSEKEAAAEKEQSERLAASERRKSEKERAETEAAERARLAEIAAWERVETAKAEKEAAERRERAQKERVAPKPREAKPQQSEQAEAAFFSEKNVASERLTLFWAEYQKAIDRLNFEGVKEPTQEQIAAEIDWNGGRGTSVKTIYNNLKKLQNDSQGFN